MRKPALKKWETIEVFDSDFKPLDLAFSLEILPEMEGSSLPEEQVPLLELDAAQDDEGGWTADIVVHQQGQGNCYTLASAKTVEEAMELGLEKMEALLSRALASVVTLKGKSLATVRAARRADKRRGMKPPGRAQ